MKKTAAFIFFSAAALILARPPAANAGGSTNRVPKFTSTYQIGNSAISDNGTTVSTTEPFTANGLIQSTVNGFKFPDNSVQTTAAQATSTGSALGGGVPGGFLFLNPPGFPTAGVVNTTATVTMSPTGVFQSSNSALGALTQVVNVNPYLSSGDPCGSATGAFNLAADANTGLVMDPLNHAIYFCSNDVITMIAYVPSGSNPTLNLGSGVAGTAAIPLLSINATNTGLFGDGTNIKYSMGGTEYFRMNNTGLYVGGSANPSFALDVNGSARFSTGIVGVTDNTTGSSAVGRVGEVVSISSTSFVNIAGTGSFGNVASMTLQAGDWQISGAVTLKLNGATITDYEVAISSFSANTTTDHVEGKNWLESSSFPIITANDSVAIPPFEMSIAGSTIIFLKAKGAFSVATPQALGTLQAIRTR